MTRSTRSITGTLEPGLRRPATSPAAVDRHGQGPRRRRRQRGPDRGPDDRPPATESPAGAGTGQRFGGGDGGLSAFGASSAIVLLGPAAVPRSGGAGVAAPRPAGAVARAQARRRRPGRPRPAGQRPPHRHRRADPRRRPGGRLRRGAVRRRGGHRAAGRRRGGPGRAARPLHDPPAARRRRSPRTTRPAIAMQHEIVDRTTRAQETARQGDRADPRAPRPRARRPEHAGRAARQDRGGRGSAAGRRGDARRAPAATPRRRWSRSAATSRRRARAWPARATAVIEGSDAVRDGRRWPGSPSRPGRRSRG